jgi:ABC-2 type transport system permease protein
LVVVPLTIFVGASAYCFGTFLGGVILAYRSVNNLVANVGLVAVMTLCGINVPLNAYPGPVALVAQGLPVTHGLIAIRDVLAGNMAAAGAQALGEAGVAACWLGVCLLTFRWFVYHGRRNGSLEYAT